MFNFQTSYQRKMQPIRFSSRNRCLRQHLGQKSININTVSLSENGMQVNEILTKW